MAYDAARRIAQSRDLQMPSRGNRFHHVLHCVT